jgi:hypothetical protein
VLTVGQTTSEALGLLTDAINDSGELGGVYGLAQGTTLLSNGVIEDFNASPTGGLHKSEVRVPALVPWAWSALLVLVAGAGVWRLRFRSGA